MSSTPPIVGRREKGVNVEVLVGIDPHKATNVVAAVDQDGQLLEYAVFATNRSGLRSLRRWGKRFPDRRWAVEGAGGLGRPVAQYLAASRERVVDVPAKLSSRVHLLSTGNARKNDRADAAYVALAALRNERLADVDAEEHAAVLRMLSDRREELVKERTRALNRLHGLLRGLLPGGVGKNLCAQKAAHALRGVRPRGGPARARRRLAVDMTRDVRRLEQQIRDLEGRIRKAVGESPTSLTGLFGVGQILAAKIVGRVGSVARFPSKAHFASYTGTAPIEASSGEVVRHRLSRAGNRQLNHALHMIAICQVRHATQGRAYYQRKLAEGKSEREALRCLKRRISDAVFRRLRADWERTLPASA
jgi:transposase